MDRDSPVMVPDDIINDLAEENSTICQDRSLVALEINEHVLDQIVLLLAYYVVSDDSNSLIMDTLERIVKSS